MSKKTDSLFDDHLPVKKKNAAMLKPNFRLGGLRLGELFIAEPT